MGKPLNWVIVALVVLCLVVALYPVKKEQAVTSIRDVDDACLDGDDETLFRYLSNQPISLRDGFKAAQCLGSLVNKEENLRLKYENALARLRDNASSTNEARVLIEALNFANASQYRNMHESLWNVVRPLVDSHRGPKIATSQKNGTVPALMTGTLVDLIVYAKWGQIGKSSTFGSTLTGSNVWDNGLTREEIESRIRNARIVGVVVRSSFAVGSYAGGYDATRHATELYLVDLKVDKILKAKRILGSTPPNSITVPAYQPGIKPPKWMWKVKTSGDPPDIEGYFIDRHATASSLGLH